MALRFRFVVISAVSCVGFAMLGHAAEPSAQDALKFTPVQQGVDCDTPSAADAAKCKLTPKKWGSIVGWVVEDANGMPLRRFLDTNGDNVVDQWCFFKDGVEIYRDIDSDFTGKADQHRWFNTGGSRWGLDKTEKGVIDAWKTISAEEVSAEVVGAIATQDSKRFLRLALTAAEAKSLGLPEEKAAQLAEKLSNLSAEFKKLLSEKTGIGSSSKWVQFSAGMPGRVPAGLDGPAADFLIYENAVALVETGGKHTQLQLGTLVCVGDTWRIIDCPKPIGEGSGETAAIVPFFRSATGAAIKAPSASGEAAEKLMAEIAEFDKKAASLTTAKDRAQYNAQRADMVERLADAVQSADEREMWLRQLADMIAAASTSGAFPDGAKRLDVLFTKLSKSTSSRDRDAAAHAKFWLIRVEFDQKMQASGADLGKLQTERRKAFEQFVQDYPKCADAGEVMLQLAIDHEWAGQEEEAKKWYGRIVEQFPNAPVAKRANGAKLRLDSVGKVIEFQGKGVRGETVDLAKVRGNVVLLYFWATWCEPCKTEIPVLKDLAAKYSSGFKVVGVSLDHRQQDLAAYLSENKLPWTQVFEEGGLDSTPAAQLGIVTVPTMILIDGTGKVVQKSLRAADLEAELKKLLK